MQEDYYHDSRESASAGWHDDVAHTFARATFGTALRSTGVRHNNFMGSVGDLTIARLLARVRPSRGARDFVVSIVEITADHVISHSANGLTTEAMAELAQ